MPKVVIKITKFVICIEFFRWIPGKKLAFSYQHTGKNFTPVTPMFKTFFYLTQSSGSPWCCPEYKIKTCDMVFRDFSKYIDSLHFV